MTLATTTNATSISPILKPSQVSKPLLHLHTLSLAQNSAVYHGVSEALQHLAFGIAVGGSGLRLLISEQLALGAANRRSMPPTSPPAASQGRSTVLHQPRSARTAAAKQLRTSHRGAAALLSAAAAAGQPGPRRAPRPVSPGTAALAADMRGARRPTNALNELRPLRQRVSRAAGICLPAAAAGCERSLARRCRQSAA